ncbi:non-heme iron oxygenase ferredoxin subunit [Aeromicrobium sp. CTD01-1L150]|uniref:non-heme iron oxygenase ferredoxin subunit n=1 Tax=Aeromicrobium sp. CTD01-1L150 TaxID=3341830 RepID=UPI0035C1DC1F
MTSPQFAAPLDALTDGEATAVNVDGVEIALVKDGENVYAVRDECSHAAIPLSEGEVEGCEIECWLHGSRFDARTGEALNLPATEPVPTYPTTIQDGRVMVDVSAPIGAET